MDVVEFNAGNFFFPRFPDMELPIKGFGSPPDITKCPATLLFGWWQKKPILKIPSNLDVSNKLNTQYETVRQK
jgi:hypothetical protein